MKNYEKIFKTASEHGQEHLFRYYNDLSEAEKEKLLSQAESVDYSIFEALNKERVSESRGHIEPLAAVEIDDIEKNKTEYEKTGLEAIRNVKAGAVLLAGGQGTRLGFDKPKGMFNIGITKEIYIFEMLIRNIMDVVNKAGCYIPLYIMTSDKNNEDTVNFFEQHNYFGYPKDMIKFFIQDMACSVDYNGKIYMENKYTLSLSPNGNGGWFGSMKKSGILDDVHSKGIEWLNVFSVDNVLQRICDPVFLGAVIASGFVSGSKVVRKAAPDERVGVLCLEDKKPSIVEYYEMTDDMVNLRKENGELAYNFGVTLNYLFRVDKLEEIMNNNMPVHIVEKKIPYMDNNGNFINPEKPNGYKFETLVLDMIHLLDNCLPVEIVREREFAPVKNAAGVDSVETARELLKKNGVEL